MYGLEEWLILIHIIKYDPINDTMSSVGEKADGDFECSRGALGRDRCIYVITWDCRILKINTVNDVHCFVGNSIESNHRDRGWGDAIVGIDGCIYWHPNNTHRLLKYNSHSDQISVVGDDFGGAK